MGVPVVSRCLLHKKDLATDKAHFLMGVSYLPL